MDSALFAKPEVSAARQEYYQRLYGKGAVPLWEVLADLIPAAPRPQCVPALWRYEEMRPLLIEAGGVITPEEAERRVLALENPGLRGSSCITQSLYAGLQLVLPGETTPSHRHSMSALRFVVEGEGGYTAVDGERTYMHPGDFILTPSWTYHDHGATGDDPVVWLDGLDVPIVNLFDASFVEPYPDADGRPHGGGNTQAISRPEGDALARYGANLMPLDYTPVRKASPVFNYPYSRSREALETVYRNGPVDARHGVKMQYVNPATGGYPMPTIAAFLQLLPAGFHSAPYRSTDATVYCVSEGRGSTHVRTDQGGVTTLTWGPRDVFAVPSWCPVSHHADGESVLFSFSDRPLQKLLGVWREESRAEL
jgi:gentisate 1,2-dioxygenase